MPQPLGYLRESTSASRPAPRGSSSEQELGTDIARPNAAGERIRVEGHVSTAPARG